MKKTYLAVAVAAVFAAQGVAHAQDYQSEVGLSYKNNADNVKGDSTLVIDGTYYIDVVETSGRPLAEAAFLGRNNNVSASYGQRDLDAGGDYDVFSLGAEFWFEDIYTAAKLNDVDGDNIINVRLGYMLDDGFLVTLGYESDDTGIEKIDSILLGSKYVVTFDGGAALNIEAEVGQKDDVNDTVFVRGQADYYINDSVGIGASLRKAEQTPVAYGVQASYFVTPEFSAELAFTKEEDNKDDEVGLRVAYRF